MIAFVAIAALQVASFDLACEGTIRTGIPSGITAETTPEQMEAAKAALPTRPWRVRYRVDVATDRWCEGDCTSTEPIQALNSSRLLIDGININRTHLTAQAFRSSTRDWIDGRCTVEPFSGMPTQAF